MRISKKSTGLLVTWSELITEIASREILKKLTLRLGTLKRNLLYQLMVRSLISKSQLCKLKLDMIFVYAKNIELRMYETRIKKKLIE